ncbi:MAG: PEP-CTERM sorting domain-containing protein [Puniceicoccaceae bacterium]
MINLFSKRSLLLVAAFSLSLQLSAGLILNFTGTVSSSNPTSSFPQFTTFSGSYTVDTSVAQVAHPDNSLDFQSPTAITNWNIDFDNGISFIGTSGGISLGNDNVFGTSFFDRYIASFHSPTSVGSPMLNGEVFSYAQLDFQHSSTTAATMLDGNSLSTVPNFGETGALYGGRLVLTNGNQPFLTITSFSIAAVPEPSTYALISMGVLGLALVLKRRLGKRTE